jgi:hypothetical protein
VPHLRLSIIPNPLLFSRFFLLAQWVFGASQNVAV